MIVLLKPSIRITQNGRKTFVECRGIVAKKKAHYTKKFGEIYWESQSSCRASTVSAFAASRFATSPAYLCGGHRELDALHKMLLWCSMITRIVKPKSAEARCEGAAKATQKKLSSMNSKNLWTQAKFSHSLISFAIPKYLKQCLAEFFLSCVLKIRSLVMTKRSGRPAVSFND